jgi:tRNA pseudouridine55 synthase
MKINRTDLVLNINKPAGITSFKVIAILRRALRIKKVGHAGTLDPFATGVLVVCTGRATRAIEYLMANHKEYTALVEFGTSTTTGDPEGEIIHEADTSALKKSDIQNVLHSFKGRIMQRPHAFSAVKHEGKRLYDLARQGKTPEIKERPVNIFDLDISDLTHYESDAGIKTRVYLKVKCSKGTYIRSLSEDIGKALGLPAYTVELKRTASGNFSIEDSIDLPLENVERHGAFARQLIEHGLRIEQALSFLPEPPKSIIRPFSARSPRFIMSRRTLFISSTCWCEP